MVWHSLVPVISALAHLFQNIKRNRRACVQLHHKPEDITPCLYTVTFFYKLCNSVKATNDIVGLFCMRRFYHSALRLSFFDGKAAVFARKPFYIRQSIALRVSI